MLSNLKGKYRDEFCVIELNGLLHENIRLALRDIARQLNISESDLKSAVINYYNLFIFRDRLPNASHKCWIH